MMYTKSNEASGARDVERRPDLHNTLRSDVKNGTSHLACGRIDADDVESQRAHARDVGALTAADVEPLPSDTQFLDHLRHQYGLPHQQRMAARLRDLHVVGVGDVVEVRRAVGRTRSQVHEDERDPECDGDANRGQPDPEHDQDRRIRAQSVEGERPEHPSTGDDDASGRQRDHRRNGRRAVRVRRVGDAEGPRLTRADEQKPDDRHRPRHQAGGERDVPRSQESAIRLK